MTWLIVIGAVLAATYFWKQQSGRSSVAILPPQFVVFDLETTGLSSESHEIIEIGAIRVNRDSTHHDTFQAFVKPTKKVPRKITDITGITQEMVEKDGEPLDVALKDFIHFIGDLPLVSFNSDFDMAFLKSAARKVVPSYDVPNRISCALKMARRAWPGRTSYRLTDLAKDGGLSDKDTHRALGDCERALIVYTAAATKLGSPS